jgi:hypothetical protein
MARFWIIVNWADVKDERVIASFNTANWRLLVDDMLVPVTEAWTASVCNDAVAFGVPTIVVVGPEFADSESPTFDRAGTDHTMLRPEADEALNVIGVG